MSRSNTISRRGATSFVGGNDQAVRLVRTQLVAPLKDAREQHADFRRRGWTGAWLETPNGCGLRRPFWGRHAEICVLVGMFRRQILLRRRC